MSSANNMPVAKEGERAKSMQFGKVVNSFCTSFYLS